MSPTTATQPAHTSLAHVGVAVFALGGARVGFFMAAYTAFALLVAATWWWARLVSR